jgi:hypothetical protein
VQQRNALTDGAVWTDFGLAITAEGSTTIVQLKIDASQPSRFFQVIEVE